MITIALPHPVSRPWHAAVLFPLMASMLVIFFYFLPVTYADWVIAFRPAALDLRDPYAHGVYNPPWLFPALFPLALLPARLGAACLMALSVGAVLVYLRSPLKSLAVLTSGPMLILITLGQVDALPLLGMLVPPALALPLLILKPQGSALAGLSRISPRSLVVLLAALALSFAAWGLWPLRLLQPGHLVTMPHNASLFPYSVPLGLALAWLGLRYKSDALLCWASLCLSPYWMLSSMLPAVAASVKASDRWLAWLAIWLGSWAFLVLVRL